MRNLLLFVATAMLCAAPVAAQATSPTAVVRAYFEALEAEKWDQAALFLRLDDFEVIRRQQIDANTDDLEAVFAGVRDTTLLRTLTLDQVAARWLEARDLRYQTRIMLRLAPECPQQLDSATRHALAPRVDVLGEVARGDTSWVVLRSRSDHIGAALPGAAPDAVRAATLVRRAGRWLIVPAQHYGFASIGLSHCDRSR